MDAPAPSSALPYTPVTIGQPVWYGFGLTSTLFGAPTAGIARGPKDGTHYTVIPLPVLPSGEVTMQRRADAFAATYTGRMEDAVDLYRLSVEADGWMSGLLDTMAHGILQAPLTWQGDADLVSWLSDADGTPGDFWRMHPENECAKIIRDGIGMGIGLGQYVLMCWNCDAVEWRVEAASNPTQLDVQVCKRCGVKTSARPIGQRVLYQLCWRDPRWLWRNTVSGQWRYTGRTGQVDVNAGDGEWLVFQTVPDCDVWRHGPWVWGTIAAIFARDSTFDRQYTSAVAAPAHVFMAEGATGQETRKDVEAQAEGLRWGNKIVLPGPWKHEIHAAKAEFVDVTASIVEWASTMWAVGITGNACALKPTTGFANLDFFAVIERTRRAFVAQCWIHQVSTQGLRWYVRDNRGPGVAIPVGRIDTRSPDEKLAASKADEQEGAALVSLHKGLDAIGYELEPAYVEERAQAKGYRIRPQPGGGARRLTWDPKTLAGFVTMAQAIEDQGFPPLPPGDPRASMMVAAALHPGGPATPAGATPDPAPTVAPTGGPHGGAPPQAPAAPAAATPPASPPARLEADPEDCDPGEEDCDEDARRAELAHGLAGFGQCAHGRAHRCERCGVQRTYAPPARDAEGNAVHPIAWRAIPTKRGAMARLAAPDPEVARMLERLDEALDALADEG